MVAALTEQLHRPPFRWANVQTRHLRGRRAEALVAADLAHRGCEILAVNKRLGHLELDIVALDPDGVALIVEVRTRGSRAYERALTSIAGKKKMRLLHAADRLWRFDLVHRRDVRRLRIDVAAVTLHHDGSASIEYARGAVVG